MWLTGFLLVQQGKSRTRRRFRSEVATLTLHFCDEVFATDARNRTGRVSTSGRMFGLRMSRRLLAGLLLRSPSPAIEIANWLSRASPHGVDLVLMRYRSATVADSHGLSRCLTC